MYPRDDWESMAAYQNVTTYLSDWTGTLTPFFGGHEVVMPRVCMLGRQGVGMHSLVQKYAQNNMFVDKERRPLHSNIDMRIGNVGRDTSMRISVCSFHKRHIEEQLYTQSYVIRAFGVKLNHVLAIAECILFVFDLTDKSTLYATLELFRLARTQNHSFLPLLIGTKYDLFAAQCNEDKVDMAGRVWTIAKAMNAPLIYTSAKNGDNVKNVFRMIGYNSLGLPPNDIEQKHDELNEALIYCPRSVTESICIVQGYVRCIALERKCVTVPLDDIYKIILMFYANIGGGYQRDYVTEWKEKIEEVRMIERIGNSFAQLPEELRFKPGDIVKMVHLKSKKGWNGQYATIIGAFSQQKRRWPVQINFGDRASAALQVKNLRMHQPGHGW